MPAPRPLLRPATWQRIAWALTALPLVTAALLYGEWLLSWAVLGHVPRPSLDDPKDVAFAHWLMWPVALGIVGHLPAALGAIAIHLSVALEQRRGALDTIARVLAVVGISGGFVLWMRWDPGAVVYWWFD